MVMLINNLVIQNCKCILYKECETMIKMIGYPRCSTCKNADLFLKQKNISYEYINIK